jgi:hypothetical protein
MKNSFIAIACFLVMGLVVYTRGEVARARVEYYLQQIIGNPNPEEFVATPCYLNRDQRWLVFNVGSHSDQITILATGSVPAEFALAQRDVAQRQSLPFAVEYQLLDRSNRVLEQRVVNLETKIAWHWDAEAKQPVSLSHFAEPELLPTMTKSISCTLNRWESRPAVCRVRVVSCDAPLQDISLRLFARHYRNAQSLKKVWLRATQEQRDELARASAYPAEMLTEKEQQNLMRAYSSPLAPLGMIQREFDRRILFLSSRELPIYSIDESLPEGLCVFPEGKGVIPLPAETRRIRLDFTRIASKTNTKHEASGNSNQDQAAAPKPALEPTATPGASSEQTTSGDASPWSQLTIRWFGHSIHDRRTIQAGLPKTGESLELDFSSGQLELQADLPFAVRVYLQNPIGAADAWEEITPSDLSCSCYLIDTQREVAFIITHSQQLATPLRVSFRTLITATEPSLRQDGSSDPVTDGAEELIEPAAREVQWEFFDAAGSPLQSGVVELEAIPSQYDSVMIEKRRHVVTESHDVYFQVPLAARKLVMKCADGHAFAVCYTALPQVPMRTIVPDDYIQNDPAKQIRRLWLPIRAEEHRQWIADRRLISISLQSRPPEDKRSILDGEYRFDAFSAKDRWHGRYILAPRQGDHEVRDLATGVVFFRFTPNVPQWAYFAGKPAREWVEPRVIFHKPTEIPEEICVYFDRRLHHRETVVGRQGEFSLNKFQLPPPGQPVEVRFEVTSGTHVFMNSIEASDSEMYQRRMATALENKPLVFEVEKLTGERESLNLNVWQSADSLDESSVTLAVTIETEIDANQGSHNENGELQQSGSSIGVSSAYTVQSREFTVRRSDSAAWLLNSQGATIDGGQSCVIPLAEDIPAGAKMFVKVESSSRAHTYITLTRLVTGKPTNWELFREGKQGAKP